MFIANCYSVLSRHYSVVSRLSSAARPGSGRARSRVSARCKFRRGRAYTAAWVATSWMRISSSGVCVALGRAAALAWIWWQWMTWGLRCCRAAWCCVRDCNCRSVVMIESKSQSLGGKRVVWLLWLWRRQANEFSDSLSDCCLWRALAVPGSTRGLRDRSDNSLRGQVACCVVRCCQVCAPPGLAIRSDFGATRNVLCHSRRDWHRLCLGDVCCASHCSRCRCWRHWWLTVSTTSRIWMRMRPDATCGVRVPWCAASRVI